MSEKNLTNQVPAKDEQDSAKVEVTPEAPSQADLPVNVDVNVDVDVVPPFIAAPGELAVSERPEYQSQDDKPSS